MKTVRELVRASGCPFRRAARSGATPPSGQRSRARLEATALAVLSLAILATVSAQSAVQISPVNLERNVQPGSHLSGSITITNPTQSKLTISIFPADFTIQASGRLLILPSGSLPTSAAPWLSLSQHSLTLAGGASASVRYRASVPEKVKSGTHWSAIVFRSAGSKPKAVSKNGIGLSLVAQDAYILYLNVGKPSPSAQIQSLTLQGAKSQDPPSFDVALQNTGNELLIVHGRIEVRSLDGKLVHTYTVPTVASLPGSARDLAVPVTPPLKAGTYLVTSLLADGTSSEIAGQAQVTVH